MSEGIWTMTDSEFEAELAKAWDEGASAALDALNRHIDREPYKIVNPYRDAGAGE